MCKRGDLYLYPHEQETRHQKQPQAGSAPVRAPDHQSVGSVGQRVRAPRTLRPLEGRAN